MKTLVMNAGYEPLSIVPFTRAVVLVLTGKGEKTLRDGDFPKNTVIFPDLAFAVSALLAAEPDDAWATIDAVSAGLDHLWPRARIRYGQRGTAADISRPLRAHALASAVEAAVVQLAEPANHELGAPLNAEAERLDAPAAPEAPRAAPTRVYRGQAY